jgi:hypothetical protein
VAAAPAACAHVPADDVSTRGDAASEATAPTTTWPPLLDRVWDQIEASYEAISSAPGVTLSVSTGEPELDPAFPGCALGERVVTLHAIEASPTDRYLRTAGPNGDRHWNPSNPGAGASPGPS